MRIAPKSAEDRIKFRLGGHGIPESAVKDERSGEGGEAWSWAVGEKLYAIAFRGSSFKSEWYYRFRTEAERAERLRMFFKSIAEWSARMAERKAARVAAPRGLEVGDVLRSSWGYDQTNIDYYEVTKLVGKAKVEIRKIGGQYEETGFMCGRSVPTPGSYVGEPMVKLARNGGVKVREWGVWATKMEPKVVAGAKVYSSSYESSYA